MRVRALPESRPRVKKCGDRRSRCGSFANADRSARSVQPSHRRAGKDHDAEHKPINHEWPTGKFFQNLEQAPYGKESRNGGDADAEDQHRPCVPIKMNLVKLPQLLEAG